MAGTFEMICCEAVSKRWAENGFGNSSRTLEDVSFSVAEGEFVCLLGPSGCGKTTLLNIIAGFIPPSLGRVLFNRRPVTGPGPDRGVVFQDPTLFPWLTVTQNIAFGLINQRVPEPKRQAKVDDALRLVGLESHANAYPHELSGGMRQRIALARVLVLEPQALLMDEPFSALDAISRERLQDELLGIWQRGRISVIFVTHNAEEAAYLADRVILLGPPPRSICGVIPVPLPRPRSRNCEALYKLVQLLRQQLGDLPCCIPTASKKEF
ncbi:MAG: ABC transporter ATP-binding protein [Pseudomonadota bacterium]